jgi:hypothetical protein
MKTKTNMIGVAIVAILITFTACKKNENVSPVTSDNSAQTSTPIDNSGAKSNGGFGIISLREISGSGGVCQINTAYIINVPGSGVYQNVVFGVLGGPNITYITGIVSIANNTTTLFGVTSSLSNNPGKLLKISATTKVAGVVGNTTKVTGAPIYLQDIERTKDGKIYYAIEIGTKNIYISIPSAIGNPPLIWTLVATLPVAPGATSALQGLDIYNGWLVVYGNGTVPTSPFPNIVGTIGYYARYNIGGGGALTYVGTAATNTAYTLSPNEDAALLISDDTSINGTFVVIATPSFSAKHFYNQNTNLPYILFGANANFASTFITGFNGLLDYTYFI